VGKSNVSKPRAKQFQVRLSEIEKQMLEELAALEGLTPSEWIRFRIRHVHKLVGEKR
jgi:hypothetical protein